MQLMTVDEFCDVRYGLHGREPTKAQRNTVTRMCREGIFRSAFKVGRRWLIDMEAEIGGKNG